MFMESAARKNGNMYKIKSKSYVVGTMTTYEISKNEMVLFLIIDSPVHTRII